VQPLLRRERFQQLAQVTAAGGEGDPIRPLLAKAIGQGLLRRAVAPDGTYTLRVQRQTLVDRENIDSPERSLSDPYAPGRNSTAYEGAIILSGDEAYFSEIAPAQQRAGLREEGTANGDQP
jgi:hypothetical protein